MLEGAILETVVWDDGRNLKKTSHRHTTHHTDHYERVKINKIKLSEAVESGRDREEGNMLKKYYMLRNV